LPTAPLPSRLSSRRTVSSLCPIGDGHQLRADAAATYVAMDEAFAATEFEPSRLD
jgi:hypothetical protein